MTIAPEELSDEWLPALEAAMLIASRFGGLTVAKHALALGLREGLLSAAADGWQIFEGEDAQDTEEQKAGADELLEVPVEVFSRSQVWESDRLGWDWEIGGLDVHTEDSSYAFLGVHFLKSEVELIDPASPPFDALRREAPGGLPLRPVGRVQRPRPRYWDWERALAELVAVAHFDGLSEFGDLGRRGNQQKLEKWFEDWFRSDAQSRDGGSLREVPSEGECRKRAQFVAAAVRARGTPQGTES